MTVLKKIKSHPNVVDYFKKLPFYYKHIEQPRVKRLRNIDLLSELPFYEELNVIKTNEAKGFRYQITLKVMLKKYKSNEEIEFTPFCFNSTTKTVTNHKFTLENAFQEILFRIDGWINKGSAWIAELIESQYTNISTYRLLSGSSYVQLPVEVKSPIKGLINIENNNQKCFLWCNVRHINPVKIHPERITLEDKELGNDLNYDRVGFPVQEKDFSKIETKNNICINVFCYENRLTFPIYISNQKFKDSMDLLLVTNESK